MNRGQDTLTDIHPYHGGVAAVGVGDPPIISQLVA